MNFNRGIKDRRGFGFYCVRAGATPGQFWMHATPDFSQRNFRCFRGLCFTESKLCHCGHTLAPDIFDKLYNDFYGLSPESPMEVSLYPMDMMVTKEIIVMNSKPVIEGLAYSKITAGYFDYLNKIVEEKSSGRCKLFDNYALVQNPYDTLILLDASNTIDGELLREGKDNQPAALQSQRPPPIVSTQVTSAFSSNSASIALPTAPAPTASPSSSGGTSSEHTSGTSQAVAATPSSSGGNSTYSPAQRLAAAYAAAKSSISSQPAITTDQLTTPANRATFLWQAISCCDIDAVNSQFSLTSPQVDAIFRAYDLSDGDNYAKQQLAEAIDSVFNNDQIQRLE